MNEMTVKGRGLKKPVAIVMCYPQHLTIRIDDDTNEEFWLEIKLPRIIKTADGKTLELIETGTKEGSK